MRVVEDAATVAAREREVAEAVRVRRRAEADEVAAGAADHLMFRAFQGLEKVVPETLKPSEILAFIDKALGLKEMVYGLPAGVRATIEEQRRFAAGLEADDGDRRASPEATPRRNPYIQTVEIRLNSGKLHEDETGAPAIPAASPDVSV